MATGIITDYAGTGTAGYNGDNINRLNASFNNPSGIAYGNDNLYIADMLNQRIRAINVNTGIVRTVTGTGLYLFSLLTIRFLWIQ